MVAGESGFGASGFGASCAIRADERANQKKTADRDSEGKRGMVSLIVAREDWHKQETNLKLGKRVKIRAENGNNWSVFAGFHLPLCDHQ
jgi:hypothetical protein